MNKYTTDEMINAVTVIKEVCEQHDCPDCPFHKYDDDCVIQGILPTDWEIKTPVMTIFK